jgi:hypothetical protein
MTVALTLRKWKVVSMTALALIGFVASSLPASAARVDNFGPTLTGNPACLQPDGYTVKSGIPGYPLYGYGLFAPLTDDSGISTASTYTKGSQWCLRADWHFAAAAGGGTCEYYFYVPNDASAYYATGGGANATIVIGFYGPDGRTLVAHSDPVDEASASGFYLLRISGDKNISTAFTGINLGDNTGVWGQQLGLGLDSNWSLRRVCY